MISANEYLKTLNEKSVWVFTKQKVSNFEETIKATSFFENIPNKETTNIEEYFKVHHKDYGIETTRHRMLVIPQFYGLLTKTPFYKRGGTYNKEKTTQIYDKLKKINPFINRDEYNKVITEQILKIKIHAIIDTDNNNEDYHILPIIFIYKVLKELKLQYGIDYVSIEHLYTYIMTCKKYEDWEMAVQFIKDNSPISKYVKHYKDYSRILTLIRNNTKLFHITSKTISINEKFDNYFYNNFMLKFNIEELNEILYRDVDYSYFLYNYQNFDINLIDEPNEIEEMVILHTQKQEEIIQTEQTEKEIDDNYIEKVNDINENNVNPDVAIGASKVAPKFDEKSNIAKKYKRNPLLGKIAISNAYYCCENNPRHETFLAATTNKSFMEAHHLVPVKYQQKIWNEYNINVDCVENIVALCPTCHRAFHNGTNEVKRAIIRNVYEKLLPRYKSIGFNIKLEDIEKLYKV